MARISDETLNKIIRIKVRNGRTDLHVSASDDYPFTVCVSKSDLYNNTVGIYDKRANSIYEVPASKISAIKKADYGSYYTAQVSTARAHSIDILR